MAVPACVQGAWASPEEQELKKGLEGQILPDLAEN